jgi:hypothetical protein
MSPISYGNVARKTSIRTRYKSFSALELKKLEFIVKASFVVAGVYIREINPEKKPLRRNNSENYWDYQLC